MFAKWITWWGLLTGFGWGTLVLFQPHAMAATPLSTVADLFGRSRLGVSFALITAACAAFVGVSSRAPITFMTRALLFPQVFLMLLACGGSLEAVVKGMYADGVPRPWSFILADQMPWIVASIIYTAAVVEHFGRGIPWNIGFRFWRR
jgi:hypothetical protein